jgi:hypothetical protein
MHPEIEKLIELALADGQVTEKERNVIFKKAFELGVDADEVEMVLDGKLHQLEASIPKEKEKVGNIKTCPACGASVKAFQITCDDCGHELNGTKANVTISKLLEELKNSKEEKHENIINCYPIPINKEDLFEFLQVSCTQSSAGSNEIIKDAWLKKSKETLLKSKLAFVSDDKYKLLNDYEILINKNEKKKKWDLVLLIFILLIFFTFIGGIVIFGPTN